MPCTASMDGKHCACKVSQKFGACCFCGERIPKPVPEPEFDDDGSDENT